MIKLNGDIINFFTFSNKESKLKLDNVLSCRNDIEFKYESDIDLIRLMFVKKEIHKQYKRADVHLLIYYMPYSRMDRAQDGVAFTLEDVTEFINYLNFNAVSVIEPHSDVTFDNIHNCNDVKFSSILYDEAISTRMIDFDPNVDVVCYPDKGAQKRHSEDSHKNVCVGFKERDFETGRIKSLEIQTPKREDERNIIYERNVIILDDLCCKGGTFMLTAKELRRRGAKNITLIVSHCEHAIFEGDILNTDLIDTVITSNSIINQADSGGIEKMIVVNVTDLI